MYAGELVSVYMGEFVVAVTSVMKFGAVVGRGADAGGGAGVLVLKLVLCSVSEPHPQGQTASKGGLADTLCCSATQEATRDCMEKS